MRRRDRIFMRRTLARNGQASVRAPRKICKKVVRMPKAANFDGITEFSEQGSVGRFNRIKLISKAAACRRHSHLRSDPIDPIRNFCGRLSLPLPVRESVNSGLLPRGIQRDASLAERAVIRPVAPIILRPSTCLACRPCCCDERQIRRFFVLFGGVPGARFHGRS